MKSPKAPDQEVPEKEIRERRKKRGKNLYPVTYDGNYDEIT